MNTLKKLSFLVVLISSLTAWADQKDDNYMSYVDPYLGDYAGNFDGRSGTLRLMVVDGELVAEFYSSSGEMGLIRGCDAEIGSVRKADVDEKDGRYEIDTITFRFHPGNCRNIEGRDMTLDFKHSGATISRLNVSVLEYTETRYDTCYDPIYNPGYPGYPGYPNDPWRYPRHCSPSVYQHMMTGKFTKM